MHTARLMLERLGMGFGNNGVESTPVLSQFLLLGQCKVGMMRVSESGLNRAAPW